MKKLYLLVLFLVSVLLVGCGDDNLKVPNNDFNPNETILTETILTETVETEIGILE